MKSPARSASRWWYIRLFHLFFVLLSFPAAAATVDDFVPRIYTNSLGTLPYRLFIPTNYSAGKSYPIVLFLHGAGERGSDNRLQLTGQTGELVFVTASNQARYPSFMVAPQCPTSGVWDDSTRRQQVLGLMNSLLAEFSIDPKRLYITGLSMGGYGTWDYITQFPSMYAAAIPMSSGGNSALASRIIRMPIWNFHSANDTTVAVSESRTMVSSVRRAGGNVIYTEYATGGHGIWTPAYNTPILMDWVYSQRLASGSPAAPILTISTPTTEPIYASTNIASLNLAGTASDGNNTVTLVTWTNYLASSVVSGTATGTANWSVSSVALDSSVTNLVLVLARGTSWYPTLGGNTTFNDALSIIFPPVIQQQPQSRTANQGDAVIFTVTVASNRSGPAYQWRFNGSNLAGQTSSSLTLVNVQSTNSGLYSVQVSNRFGAVLSSAATLAVDRPPVAVSQSVTLNEDTPASITLMASDPDGDALTYTVTVPAHGTLSGTAPNLTYLPATNYNGPDSFTFHVNDGQLDSPEATISLTVLPVNDPPVAQSRTVMLDEDTPVMIMLLASDVDGDPLTYTVTSPAHGTLTGTPPLVTYIPSTNYFGPDNFTFKVNDGQADSAVATVSLIIASVNDAPIAIAKISPLLQLTPDGTNLLVLSLNNSNAAVVLDASQSYDVENDPLQFSWFERGGGLLATGILATNVLPVGLHTIDLVVSDGMAQTTNTVVFEIIKASDAVAELIQLVEENISARQRRNPMEASLNAAAASFDRGNSIPGTNQLGAFQNKVRAQIAPDDPSLAQTLISAAQAIIDAMAGDGS